MRIWRKTREKNKTTAHYSTLFVDEYLICNKYGLFIVIIWIHSTLWFCRLFSFQPMLCYSWPPFFFSLCAWLCCCCSNPSTHLINSNSFSFICFNFFRVRLLVLLCLLGFSRQSVSLHRMCNETSERKRDGDGKQGSNRDEKERHR